MTGAARARLVLVLCVCVFVAVPSPAAVTALPLSGAPACRIFPKNNVWNKRVDKLPKKKNSDAIIQSIGLDEGVHPDFGSGKWNGGPIGIPYTIVGPKQKRSRVKFHYASESDKGPYPIPRDVKIEGGKDSDGDRHALIVDRKACKLYELYSLRRVEGRWRAGSGAIWNLESNKLRPKGWTSADAAGLPILAGLARYNEVKRGRIDHALRFTVSQTRAKYIYPARHFASESNDENLPPMGLRVRLKKSFKIKGFPRQVRIVLRALKRYGMIVADNGADWYISGAPNPNWNNDALHRLHEVEGRNFVVVDTSNLRP
jgi:hypothetical protein